MAYTFDSIEARDPANPAMFAANASILIYAPGDPTKTPLTITDTTGSPLPNPITVNQHGYGPAFMHPTLDRVAWASAGFTNYFTSYEGIKNEAVAARQAADTAASHAAEQASEGVASVVADAGASKAAAEASAAAAKAAADLVGAPADTAIEAAILGAGTKTKAALSATILDKTAGVYAPASGSPNYLQNSALVADQIRTADSTAMRPWLGALAGRHFAPARIMSYGDSRVEGEGTTVALSNRSIERALRQLKATLPTDGGAAGPNLNYYPTKYVATTVNPLSKWTYTGTAIISNGFGLGGRVVTLAGGQAAQFVSKFTTAKIAWTRTNAASSFRWRVDGGAWTTVSTTGGLGDGYTTPIGPLTSANHTIDIEQVSGTVYIAGAIVFDGDENRGIQWFDAGHHGMRSDNTGYLNLTYLTQTTAMVNPHCVLINVGTNDHGNNTPPATYQANMESIISAITVGCTLPPTIVLVAEAGRSSGFTYPWSDYVDRMRALAAADPAHRTLLDLSLRMPALSDNSLGIWYDALHENNKGQAFKADAFASFLSPR